MRVVVSDLTYVRVGGNGSMSACLLIYLIVKSLDLVVVTQEDCSAG